MLTLAEAEKYTTNSVYAGIVEEYIRNSPIFRYLSFMDVEGNAWQYLRENARSTAAFYNPNEVINESTPTTTQVTVALKEMFHDIDIDNFLKETRSNYTDIEAEYILEGGKIMRFTFLDEFFYGDTAVNAKGFTGLHGLTPSGQQINQGSATTAAALSITNLDALMDEIEGEPADILVTTKRTRRRINAYTRANGLYESARDEWGNMMNYYQGVPLFVDDSLVDTETISGGDYSAKTGGSSSSIFAVRFGMNGIFGIQKGSSIEKIEIGQLESKDAMRHRLRWYVAMGLYSTLGLARIDGIDSSVAVVS